MAIQYPYANDEGGVETHIEFAVRGNAYTCLICDISMIAKQGDKNAWHFAHKSAEDERTCQERAMDTLHDRVRDAIYEGATSGQEYNLVTPCRCGGETFTDLSDPHWQIYCEQAMVPGTRADVGATYYDRNRSVVEWIAIEVVVTHPPEPQTLFQYRAYKTVVAQIDVELTDIAKWRDTIHQYKREARVNAIMHPLRCDDCVANGAPISRRGEWVIIGDVDDVAAHGDTSESDKGHAVNIGGEEEYEGNQGDIDYTPPRGYVNQAKFAAALRRFVQRAIDEKWGKIR